MDTQELLSTLVANLLTEGFELDEEERTYTVIDHRGRHEVVSYRKGNVWITITQTVEETNALSSQE